MVKKVKFDQPSEATISKLEQMLKQRTCPNCLNEYTLGKTGTVAGCDKCEGIVRLPNGMIDEQASKPETYVQFIRG